MSSTKRGIQLMSRGMLYIKGISFQPSICKSKSIMGVPN